MSNIFLMRHHLQELSASKELTKAERRFMGSLVKTPVATAYEQVQQEIKKTSYFSFKKPHTHFTYLRELNKIQTTLKAVHTHKEKIKKQPKRFNKKAADLDALYQNTIDHFQGTLVLPINQGFEARLGDSGGECFGYVAYWAKKLLQNKKPFGIDPEGSPFKPIPLNSKLGRQHPELNHLAILNDEITQLQKSQRDSSLLSKVMSRLFSSTNQKQSITSKIELAANFVNPYTVAGYLISLADINSSKIYHLSAYEFLAGHAMGFCKYKNKYHFFDSNSGWYRFNTEVDFLFWLPYYFKKMNYGDFRKFVFKSYSVSEPSQKKEIEKKEEKHSIIVTVIAAVAMLVFSPILAVILLGIIAKKLFWDGGKRAYYTIKDWIKNKLHPKHFPKDKPLKVTLLKKSVDDIKIIPLTKKKKTMAHILPRSYRTISAVLDIPLDKLKAAEKRAAINPEFKKVTIKHKEKEKNVQRLHTTGLRQNAR